MAAALLGALAVVGVGASPASAGGCFTGAFPDADARLRLLPGPYTGDGSYTIPTSVMSNVVPGQTVSWKLQYDNEKSVTRNIYVRLVTKTPGAGEYFRIRYSVGGTDVTRAIKTGGAKFTAVAPGGKTAPMRIDITTRSNAPLGQSMRIEMTGAYHPTVCGDSVRMGVNDAL
jgi:hypothetical protein